MTRDGTAAGHAGEPGGAAGRDGPATATGPGRDDAGGPRRDEAEVRALVERFAAVLTDSGIPRMPSRIFAALLVSDRAQLTATELAAALRISPAAVSGGVRYLTQVGLVTRETRPGSRQQVYRVPQNVWSDLMRIRDQVVARWAGAMRELATALGPDTPAGQRMAESAVYFDFVSREVPLMDARWEEYKRTHLG